MAKNIKGRFVALAPECNRFAENRRGTKSFVLRTEFRRWPRRVRQLSARRHKVAWRNTEHALERGDPDSLNRVERQMFAFCAYQYSDSLY